MADLLDNEAMDDLYEGVASLFPSVDRQALRCFARLVEKDAGLLHGRLQAAEAELARLRAAGAFNEGIEAAVAYFDSLVDLVAQMFTAGGSEPEDAELRRSFRKMAVELRSLRRPETGGS